MMTLIDRARLADALAQEEGRFVSTHPRSLELFKRARQSLLAGVPMNWMVKWAGNFPVFVTEGQGAYFADVDGHRYLDLCLGDTGAMTGHAPAASVEAIIERVRKGATFMLPTEDSIWVGEELQRRFGLRYWQFTLTATDANRFAIRLARQITGRRLILVFNWCYHGDVACVLAEPVMTNIGIIHPDPGYHDALRAITRRTGTLLIIDETHTLCAGPGGYTRAHALQPDMLTLGKPIGSGIPGAVYGFSESVAARIRAQADQMDQDAGGIGGTLAGNALSLAAMRATLDRVLTPEAYAHTIPLAERFEAGVQSVIAEKRLPWIVKRLGCRAEYWV